MRAVVALALLAPFADVARAEEDASGRAFVELVAPQTECFEEEPMPVRLRFGVDAEFFRARAVQRFQQRLDLPVQLDAPWLTGLPGAAMRAEAATPAMREGFSFVLNGTIARSAPAAEVTRDGRRFTVVEIERTFLPQRAGTLVVPAPRLRFSYATSFDDDFVQERLPADRHEAVVEGRPLEILVRALPGEGRPPEFTGAVGRFSFEAAADRSELAVGESARLTLVVEGDGNLESFDAPRLDGLPGLHVLGTIDDRARPRRTIRYDVTPLAAMTELPPIAWAWFDPAPPGRYVRQSTRSIPFRVRAPAGDGHVAATEREDDGAPSAAWLLGLALAAAAVVAAAIVVVRRKPASEAEHVDPRGAQIRQARALFESRAVAAGDDLADSLAAFLAACLDCPVAAVISPDLATRLTGTGVPAGLAARTAALLESLVAARYGGAGREAQASLASSRALVEELEASFLRLRP